MQRGFFSENICIMSRKYRLRDSMERIPLSGMFNEYLSIADLFRSVTATEEYNEISYYLERKLWSCEKMFITSPTFFPKILNSF